MIILMTPDEVSLLLALCKSDVNRSCTTRWGLPYCSSPTLPLKFSVGQIHQILLSTLVFLPRDMAPSAPSVENIRAHSEVHSSKIYVTASDLQVRQAWATCTVGFAYRLDPARLRSALQSLVDQFYPVLASR